MSIADFAKSAMLIGLLAVCGRRPPLFGAGVDEGERCGSTHPMESCEWIPR